ncbi:MULTISPECIES: deoxyribose-phosphate aldolase [unclassified Halorhabdus]|uniref:deoxyribose-phosphate aldolase n=1 Tax=unclassified Halorhabdus TaxID=2621901 RepID=UPI0023D98C56|nr:MULTISPECIES: deoxyribose-phosphate aldolase [unclassified Halorhabdus]WEL17755.1 Deoxyribose-phosphate aldolase [Halorhabdus sp. SVX81]WEL21633.1 Deoxyribose-phosphate aldolase [Halorhabdus sp. BNX81]
MLPEDVPARIEHTVLGPETTPAAVIDVLDDAIEYGMAACVPPCYVAQAGTYAPEVRLATVVGFPHGQHASSVKAAEAAQAGDDGADELDMVCNIGQLKAGEDELVRTDIAEVVAATSLPVKVIVEAPLLTDAELDRVGQLTAEAGADFLKTSTGFNGGATVADVERLSRYLPVKASGGIGSWEKAKAMFEAGAERIGASRGATIVDEYRQSES